MQNEINTTQQTITTDNQNFLPVPEIIIKPEFKNLLPELNEQQKAWLEADIIKNGCIHPLVLWNNILLDGFHRYKICNRHKISFRTVTMAFDSEVEAMYWCWSHQKNRRNLTAYEASVQALQFEPLLKTKAKEKQIIGGELKSELLQKSVEASQVINTQKELAKLANVSHDTIAKVKVIEQSASEDLKQQLRNEETSINQVYRELKNAEMREMRIKKIAEVSKNNAALNLPKKYAVILADCPWRYSPDGVGYGSRAIENHYPTMDIEEIKALPVKDVVMDDAILFLWSTSPKLQEAFSVIDAWGFNYKTCAIWDKIVFSMGSYFRQQHELLLVCKKGNIPAPRPQDRPPSVIVEQKGEHSVKPKIIYEIIEKMYPHLPKLELFARGTPYVTESGFVWSSWGNEIH